MKKSKLKVILAVFVAFLIFSTIFVLTACRNDKEKKNINKGNDKIINVDKEKDIITDIEDPAKKFTVEWSEKGWSNWYRNTNKSKSQQNIKDGWYYIKEDKNFDALAINEEKTRKQAYIDIKAFRVENNKIVESATAVKEDSEKNGVKYELVKYKKETINPQILRNDAIIQDLADDGEANLSYTGLDKKIEFIAEDETNYKQNYLNISDKDLKDAYKLYVTAEKKALDTFVNKAKEKAKEEAIQKGKTGKALEIAINTSVKKATEEFKANKKIQREIYLNILLAKFKANKNEVKVKYNYDNKKVMIKATLKYHEAITDTVLKDIDSNPIEFNKAIATKKLKAIITVVIDKNEIYGDLEGKQEITIEALEGQKFSEVLLDPAKVKYKNNKKVFKGYKIAKLTIDKDLDLNSKIDEEKIKIKLNF